MIWQPKQKPRPGVWHRYFAWTPVKLVDGRMAWLCFVQRRLVDGDWGDLYQYSYPSYFSV